jgi:hypothetical protein
MHPPATRINPIMTLILVTLITTSSGSQELQNSIYRIGKTIAIVSHAMSSITDCRIYDVDKHSLTAEEDIMSLGVRIIDVQLHEMLNLIERCRLLDLDRLSATSTTALPAAAVVPEEDLTFRSTDDEHPLFLTSSASRGNFTDMMSLWRGMVPGTKWCGPGDEASNYSDVGEKFLVDTCCRSHDLCPVRLRPFRMGFGMVNFSVYTK